MHERASAHERAKTCVGVYCTVCVFCRELLRNEENTSGNKYLHQAIIHSNKRYIYVVLYGVVSTALCVIFVKDTQYHTMQWFICNVRCVEVWEHNQNVGTFSSNRMRSYSGHRCCKLLKQWRTADSLWSVKGVAGDFTVQRALTPHIPYHMFCFSDHL